MISKVLKIPLTAGKIRDITQQEFTSMKFVPYGIYRCIIEVTNKKLFTRVKSNYYTHHEINYAKSLKLNIKVVSPFIEWDKQDIVSADKIFKPFVDYLWKIKQTNKKIKPYLNSLWGILCRNIKNKTRVYKIEDVPDTVIRMDQIAEDEYKCNVLNGIKYKTSYARMKPFLLGLARVKMHKVIKKIGHNKVVFAHTDSLFTTYPVSHLIKVNKNIGCWKFEGQFKRATIKNMNTYILNSKNGLKE